MLRRQVCAWREELLRLNAEGLRQLVAGPESVPLGVLTNKEANMPRYDFECQVCHKTFDVQTSMAEYTAFLRDGKIHCPKCASKKVTRVFGPASILSSSSRAQSRAERGGCCCQGGKCV